MALHCSICRTLPHPSHIDCHNAPTFALPFTARHDHIDKKVVNMRCQCDKSVDATTMLVSAMVVVVPCCFSSEDLFGKEQDKGVMNLPSKKVCRLAGCLKEFNQCHHTMGELRALIFLLHGRCHVLELVVDIFGGVAATKKGGKQ